MEKMSFEEIFFSLIGVAVSVNPHLEYFRELYSHAMSTLTDEQLEQLDEWLSTNDAWKTFIEYLDANAL